MIELAVLFFVIVGGCTWLFRVVAKAVFGTKSGGYIDKSTHHHYYDHRQVHVHKKELHK